MNFQFCLFRLETQIGNEEAATIPGLTITIQKHWPMASGWHRPRKTVTSMPKRSPSVLEVDGPRPPPLRRARAKSLQSQALKSLRPPSLPRHPLALRLQPPPLRPSGLVAFLVHLLASLDFLRDFRGRALASKMDSRDPLFLIPTPLWDQEDLEWHPTANRKLFDKVKTIH